MPLIINLNRGKAGNQIAEFPPALIILFFMVFFPFLNMVYIGLAYGAGWYLNEIEMRQVACQAPLGLTANPLAQGQTVQTYSKSQIYSPESNPPVSNLSLPQWNNFMGVTEAANSPQVVYMPVNGNGSTQYQSGQVQVTTIVNVKPFLSLNNKWLPRIPGVNESITFNITNSILQEEEIPLPPAPGPAGAAS